MPLECREPVEAARCRRGVVPSAQNDRSKSVSSAWPEALSRIFSGFRSLRGVESEDCQWI